MDGLSTQLEETSAAVSAVDGAVGKLQSTVESVEEQLHRRDAALHPVKAAKARNACRGRSRVLLSHTHHCSLHAKQDFACRGIYLLCTVVGEVTKDHPAAASGCADGTALRSFAASARLNDAPRPGLLDLLPKQAAAKAATFGPPVMMTQNRLMPENRGTRGSKQADEIAMMLESMKELAQEHLAAQRAASAPSAAVAASC